MTAWISVESALPRTQQRVLIAYTTHHGRRAEREAKHLAQIAALEKERDALRAENERIDEAMESLLIRCDDSDSAMYGTLSTSFVRDTVRIARGAMEESK